MNICFFVKLGTQIDSAYRDELLLMAATRSIADEVDIFQQVNASAHRAHRTVELLRREMAEFIAPQSRHAAAQQRFKKTSDLANF